MKYFSVPSDFKTHTIDRFEELNNKYEYSTVNETYGQITSGNIVSSGRVTEVLPEISLTELERYIAYSKSRGVGFNYTLNPACFGNYEFSERGIREITSFLRKLNDIGVENLTLTSPSLMELAQASGGNFKIKASAICEITSAGKAAFYKKLGVERVVLDPDITREFEKIRGIYQVFGDGMEIIVNNVCYKNCAYKMFHYNHDAHCTSQNGTAQEVKDYYFNRCAMQKASDVRSFIRLNWIRPEDLKHYYSAGIRHFKIQGRQNVLQGDIVKTLEHYMKGDFDGNLFELITIFAPYNSFQPYVDNKKLEGYLDSFIKQPGFCKDTCDDCGYCAEYLQRSLNYNSTKNLNEKAAAFYKGYDRYTKLIHEAAGTRPVRQLFNKTALEQDFGFEQD